MGRERDVEVMGHLRLGRVRWRRTVWSSNLRGRFFSNGGRSVTETDGPRSFIFSVPPKLVQLFPSLTDSFSIEYARATRTLISRRAARLGRRRARGRGVKSHRGKCFQRDGFKWWFCCGRAAFVSGHCAGRGAGAARRRDGGGAISTRTIPVSETGPPVRRPLISIRARIQTGERLKLRTRLHFLGFSTRRMEKRKPFGVAFVCVSPSVLSVSPAAVGRFLRIG
ncbi:hypothetical protein EVAR_95127_1 [Eumeta japonica]|uniref:Uncharacterized protein n=1 Tax=Eumeta variegata TaxID=151549 RepID=A0A4C1W8G9_EUMVA|nr:hypothetical protein EVAR_95127_1 [Eumeta japonica]